MPNNENPEILQDDADDMAPDLISLVDEDGVEHQFEIADTLEINGENYMALIPLPDEDEEEDLLDDSGELVVLKVAEDGEEEFLEAIEDEDEFNRISSLFMERLKDEFDFAQDDD